MKNLKVRSKLFLSFGIILFLFVFSVGAGLLGIHQIQTYITRFYTSSYQIQSSANQIKLNLSQLQTNLYRSVTTTDDAINRDSQQKINEIMSSTVAALENISSRSVGDLTLLNDLNKSRDELAPIRNQVLELAMQNKNEESLALIETDFKACVQDFSDKLDTMIIAVNDSSEALIGSVNAARAGASALLTVMCIASVFVSIFLCFYITKLILFPLNEIKAAADQMSQGNLRAEISYHSRDEFGQVAERMRQTLITLNTYVQDLASAMRALASGDLTPEPSVAFLGDFVELRDSLCQVFDALNHTISNLNTSADQVSNGADQVSSGAQALSQGATEQASSLQQLAATINEISNQVQNNADNAVQASARAQAVGQEMAQSNEKMQDMIRAMSDISNSSQEISKIIKTIEDIAFQTNILALNAAVEAARAGAAGKGFAVVADEVRNLANKSQEASKNTSVLIEHSIQSVVNGTQIADETAQALLTAVDGANEVAATIDRISEATSGQAISLSQVTQGVDQISAVVQTNSATAEESAATSEQLSSQSQILKSLVGRFHLRADHVDGSASAGLPHKSQPEAFQSVSGSSKY